ncbi:MAG TPA: hypothetical protein IGS40_11510 [Trichormus sp. M33_DOE_039]|nr:hypothetical protein [Trichormus sp. M33_DOE_039]
MSTQITAKYMTLPIMSVFLGSCFALLTNPVQAQTVLENLPPPPNYSQNQPIEFNQYQPAQSPYNQSFQRYSVYVESNSSWTLQRIRQVEPSAYIRQYNGRSVIQSGVFNQRSNAEQRVRELDAIGIYGSRIASFDSGQEVPYSPGNGNSGNVGRKSRYYVTIPTKSEDLSIIANQVRQVTGLYGFVAEKRQPLGPHVAVGPFSQRTEAERWNNFIRDRGFGDARVYYDR